MRVTDRLRTWRRDAAIFRGYGDDRTADLLERLASEPNTNHETLRLVYDNVSLEEMREAMGEPEAPKGEPRGSAVVDPPVNTRRPHRTSEAQMSLRLSTDE